MSDVGRLWIRFIKKQRLSNEYIVVCEPDEVEETLYEALQKMDLSKPLWLDRHSRDWQQHHMTRFAKDHFDEVVDFDWMDLSYIEADD